MARLASGGRHGLAQSLFQVGGNGGSALGPLLAAFVVVPVGAGQHRVVLGRGGRRRCVLCRVGRWYLARTLAVADAAPLRTRRRASPPCRAARVVVAVGVLLA